MSDSVLITVPSHPKYLYVVRSALFPIMIDAGFSKKDAQRIILAVDEACSNVIKYAYEGDPTRDIALAITTKEGQVTLRISDTGRKPDIASIKPRSLDDVRPGGLGTYFIREVFDSVHYDIDGPQGTVLTLMKTRHP